MSKKVLIISTSLRSNSNSEHLADVFMKGVLDAGNEVEKISLKEKTIAFCKGCLACHKVGKCVIPDDAPEITEKIRTAEVIVWATPIYYYEMSGQMKTMIDRANSLYTADYAFHEVYVLSTAAEDEEGVDVKAVQGVQGWIDCFENVELKGTVFAGGVSGPGEMENHPALQEAYDMGRNI